MDQLDSSWISQTVTTWLSSGSGLFLADGSSWLHSLAVIMLVMFSARWAIDAMSGGTSAGIFGSMGAYIFWLVIATFLLRFYNTAMPFAGVSFSGLIPDTATTLAGKVDQSAMGSVLDAIRQIEAAGRPSPLKSVTEMISGFELLGMTLAMRGLMFLLSTAGFIAIGIGVAVGPLSIPFLVVPRLSWIFWNWLAFMISASMFQVVASILGAMWSHILLLVFSHFFHGDYSLVDAAKLLGPFVALNFCMAFSCLSVGAMTAALYGGAASSFDGFGRTLVFAVKGI